MNKFRNLVGKLSCIYHSCWINLLYLTALHAKVHKDSKENDDRDIKRMETDTDSDSDKDSEARQLLKNINLSYVLDSFTYYYRLLINNGQILIIRDVDETESSCLLNSIRSFTFKQ